MSASDVFASGFVLLGLTLAAKPADKDHPYGHGRIEILTGLLIGLSLSAGGALICYGSIARLGHEARPTAPYTEDDDANSRCLQSLWRQPSRMLMKPSILASI